MPLNNNSIVQYLLARLVSMTDGFHKGTLPLRNLQSLIYVITQQTLELSLYILQIKQLFTVVPLTSRHDHHQVYHIVLHGVFSRASSHINKWRIVTEQPN